MQSRDFVDDAAHWARRLTLSEMQCPGDYGPAMRRLSRKLGVRWTVLKNLHYRAPKIVDVADFTALGEAYDQRQLYRKERSGYRPKTVLGRLLVRALDTALDEGDGAVGDGDEPPVKISITGL